MEFRPILSSLLKNKVTALLVVLQIAISLAVLTNALHIVKLRLDIAARPTGIAAENDVFYLIAKSNLQLSFEQRKDQYLRFLDTIKSVPGVISVADTTQTPLSSSGSMDSIYVDPRQTKSSAGTTIYRSAHSLTKTLGLNVIQGRDFNDADVEEVFEGEAAEPSPSIIITKALAERLYPEASNVIGKPVYWGGFGADGSGRKMAQIVGVVERLQSPWGQESIESEFSTLMSKRRDTSSPIYLVRAAPGTRDQVMVGVESALRKSEATPLFVETRSVEGDRKRIYGNMMTIAWMLIIVSGLLVIITVSGIFGMTSLWVNQRTKIIGVRRALGARKIDILRYFITENILIGCVGVTTGMLMAIGLNQFLANTLEIPKFPLTYIACGALFFVALGVISAYAPAWRAAKIPPAIATRTA